MLKGKVVGVVVAPSHEGAWIEMSSRRRGTRRGAVAPSHEGAWIEILHVAPPSSLTSSRPLA